MHHTPIPAIPDAPPSIRNLARGRSIHDTSSSPEARVYALGAEGASSNALFAKTAPAGTLAQEARMSTVFHELGLGPEVVEYCFASMSFQQAHQYFSAVWADGFPRSRHHAVSDVR
ncbi:aminoglycoside phosphotransferase [Bifidobacterium pseudolongum]|uniref:aminoglycoside phosphotransferase n=1 Tax=Bifidobacterium pseudolongum TaxID=1694 RepID=UPI0010D26438|nr:aminoglycoside phosphotransferase [Bifidobacterium pseudolongum]RYQ03522.1 aminoglycoside phosphotransferase [Bifidobacterium pseudolongum subsp. globosum]